MESRLAHTNETKASFTLKKKKQIKLSNFKSLLGKTAKQLQNQSERFI